RGRPHDDGLVAVALPWTPAFSGRILVRVARRLAPGMCPIRYAARDRRRTAHPVEQPRLSENLRNPEDFHPELQRRARSTDGTGVVIRKFRGAEADLLGGRRRPLLREWPGCAGGNSLSAQRLTNLTPDSAYRTKSDQFSDHR